MRFNQFKKSVSAYLTTAALFISCAGTSVMAADNDYFGVNDAPHRYDLNASLGALENCKQLLASGVKWVRISPEWNSIEPAKGVYDESSLEKLDGIINYLTDGGIEPVFILGFSADWAVDPSVEGVLRTKYAPQNVEDWVSYVDFITKRYGEKVKHYEVWNEPNEGHFFFPTYENEPENHLNKYNELLKGAYETVKTNVPDGKVLLGGMSPTDCGGDSWFKKLSVDKEGYKYYDIINIHYANEKQMDTLMETIGAYPNELGDKKIWVTEAGTTSYNTAAGEQKKAVKVQDVYSLYKKYDKVERVFWYIFRNVEESNTREGNYGLLRNNFNSALPAMFAFNGVNGAYTDFARQAAYPTRFNALQSLYYLDPSISGMTGGAADGKNVERVGDYRKIPQGSKMYFRIGDYFINNKVSNFINPTVTIQVDYEYNEGTSFHMEYDSVTSPFKKTETVAADSSGTTVFTVSDGYFANRQGEKEDFCLVADSGDLTVKQVAVFKDLSYGKYSMAEADRYQYLYADITETADDTGAAVMPYEKDIYGCRTLGSGDKVSFAVADGLISRHQRDVTIRIFTKDETVGTLDVTYESTEGEKTVPITFTGSGKWGYKEVEINDAQFDEELDGKDFIFTNNLSDGLKISSVEVKGGADDAQQESVTVSDAVITAVYGTLDAGDDVRVDYTYNGEGKDCSRIMWEYSSKADGTYSVIDGRTENIYTLPNSKAGGYIRAVIIPCDEKGNQGDPVYTQPIQEGNAVLGTVKSRPNYQGTNYTNKVIEQTPEKYRFTVEGCEDEFVLLDRTEDESSRYFVTTCSDYGERIFDTTGNRYYDPAIETNLAYFLNGEFISEDYSGGRKLPKGIIDNIDYNHSWKTDYSDGAYSKEPYRRTYGIAILSRDEFYKYCDKTMGAGENPKLGVIDNLNGGVQATTKQWGLRSRRSDSGMLAFVISKDSTNNMMNTFGAKTAALIRPAFYLNDKFFETVRINLDKLPEDSEVRNTLVSYGQERLSKIYSSEELQKLGFSGDVSKQIEISEISTETTVEGCKVNVTLANAENSNVKCIAAAYRGETLLSINSADNSGNSAEIMLTVDNADSIRVFVWDSFDSMMPKAAPKGKAL